MQIIYVTYPLAVSTKTNPLFSVPTPLSNMCCLFSIPMLIGVPTRFRFVKPKVRNAIRSKNKKQPIMEAPINIQVFLALERLCDSVGFK